MSTGSCCYATSRGLGHLCHDFYLHKIIDEVFVIRHPGVPTNEEWYPNSPSTDLRQMDVQAMKRFCDRHTSMLFFETPFSWELISHCRAKGIKTAVITMYECHPEHLRPEHVPDYWFCPSLLDMDYFVNDGKYDMTPFVIEKGKGGNQATFTPLPVEYPWKLRTKAEHFVHRGGYLGVRGREGTENLIHAMRYVKNPIKLTIQVQENVSEEAQRIMDADDRIEYIAGGVPYLELYSVGDVAVGAQKWNGCSLPLQEARASGMLVMNTDRFPMNSWLPTQVCTREEYKGYQQWCELNERSANVDDIARDYFNPLIPVDHYVKGRIAGRFMEYDEAIVTPTAIAAKIDQWYGRDISRYSESAVEWAKTMSWEVLGLKYKELLS